jgi:phosphoribosylaminoimidazole-succinocarboxamide synthase
LFTAASQELQSRGLLFVDTKYEFGLLDGEVILADEIHTLDSSRFWVSSSYEEHRSAGKSPEMLDKEPIRRWLMERGFKGDGELPAIEDEYRAELMEHYTRSFERITGTPFCGDLGDPTARIEQNLKRYIEQ